MRPGRLYSVMVSPKQVLAKEDLEPVPASRRNCRLPWENSGLLLFRNYTQFGQSQHDGEVSIPCQALIKKKALSCSGCLFECHLKIAHQACGCVPWDYPHLEESISVCDRAGVQCFRKHFSRYVFFSQKVKHKVAMKKEVSSLLYSYRQGICDCPSSCESTEYPYTYHWEPLEFDYDLCYEEWFPRKNIAVLLLLNMRAGLPEWVYTCRDIMMTRKVSLVKVYFATNSFQRIIRGRGISFAGQLSRIGEQSFTKKK